MSKKTVLLAILTCVLGTSLAQADIVALKRSPGLSIDFGLDATFKAAIRGNGAVTFYSGQDMAADADMWCNTGSAPANCYRNTGANPAVRKGWPQLVKFRSAPCRTSSAARSPRRRLRFYY